MFAWSEYGKLTADILTTTERLPRRPVHGQPVDADDDDDDDEAKTDLRRGNSYDETAQKYE